MQSSILNGSIFRSSEYISNSYELRYLAKKGEIRMKSMNLLGGKDKSSEALFGDNKSSKTSFGDNKTKDMTDVEDMFIGCELLTQLDPSRSKAEDMTGIEDIFSDCKSLT